MRKPGGKGRSRRDDMVKEELVGAREGGKGEEETTGSEEGRGE